MDEETANSFIETIVKNIQALCHERIPFDQNVEVIGHLRLSIDSHTKVNYVVDEKCSKSSTSITFISNSMCVLPQNYRPVGETSKTLVNTPNQNKRPTTAIQGSPSKKMKPPDTSAIYNVPVTSTECHNISPVKFEAQSDDDSQSFLDSELEIEMSNQSSPASFIVEDEPENIESIENVEDVPHTPLKQEMETDLKEIEYTIIEYGTQHGKPLLVDNVGYSYNVRKGIGENMTWRCTIRNRRQICAATVIQKGDTFITGLRPHTHSPKPGLLTSCLIYAEVRNQANCDFLTPTSEVVQRALSVKGIDDDEANLPKKVNLTRMINRYRKHQRSLFLEEGVVPPVKLTQEEEPINQDDNQVSTHFLPSNEKPAEITIYSKGP